MKTYFVLFVYLLVISACSWKQDKKTASLSLLNGNGDSSNNHVDSKKEKRLKAAIESFADTTFKNGSLNGSILVAKDGKVLYEQYDGFSDYRLQKDTIKSTTPFHLASVSKTITGTAILKLVQDGKINLDKSVADYLPGFPKPAITIKLLLNHRSGLPNYVHYMERLGWDKNKKMTNQDVLDFLIARQNEIDIATADRGFSYSNTNYALLALVIEKASGLSYSTYLKQTFFDPLGMNNTYVYTQADSAGSMPSYFFNGKKYPFDFLDLVYGDKNIYSTVHDLLKFETALYAGTIINADLMTAAYSPYSFEKPGTHNYGLGWRMLLLKNGKKIIYHNGWWHGNRTAFYRLLDEKVTIIAFCNNDSKRIYSVKKLADLFGNYLQTNDKEDDLEKNIVLVPKVKTKNTRLAKHNIKRKISHPIASKN
ncbi:MAG: serine hydrolase domain-containing protein [Chitinophagaceae bacterium]